MTSPYIRHALPALFVLLCAGTAHASRVTMQTNHSTAGQQENAAAYVATVDAALAAPPVAGYGTADLAEYYADNQSLFGSSTNLAYRFTVEFEVTAAAAGPWSFRAGVDFGRGGVVMLDDAVLDYSQQDLWWDESWDGAGVLQGTADLQAGRHFLRVVGLDGCCDGRQSAQFRIGDGAWTTFGVNDGLQPVPEPTTAAMLLAGGALFGVRHLRRRARR